MKKDKRNIRLEDIKKKTVHSVPEQYFSSLNQRIRDRIELEKGQPRWYELPVVRIGSPIAVAAMMIIGFMLFWPAQQEASFNANELLAEVDTEEIIDYLDDMDLTEEDILSTVDVEVLASDMASEDGLLGEIELEDVEMNEIMDDLELEDINF